MENKRLVGVTICGYFYVLASILFGVGGLSLGIIDLATKYAVFAGFGAIGAIVLIPFSVLFLITGILILKLRKAGVILNLILSIWLLLGALPGLAMGLTFALFYSLPIILIFPSMIYYFTRPQVKEQFK